MGGHEKIKFRPVIINIGGKPMKTKSFAKVYVLYDLMKRPGYIGWFTQFHKIMGCPELLF